MLGSKVCTTARSRPLCGRHALYGPPRRRVVDACARASWFPLARGAAHHTPHEDRTRLEKPPKPFHPVIEGDVGLGSPARRWARRLRADRTRSLRARESRRGRSTRPTGRSRREPAIRHFAIPVEFVAPVSGVRVDGSARRVVPRRAPGTPSGTTWRRLTRRLSQPAPAQRTARPSAASPSAYDAIMGLDGAAIRWTGRRSARRATASRRRTDRAACDRGAAAAAHRGPQRRRPGSRMRVMTGVGRALRFGGSTQSGSRRA